MCRGTCLPLFPSSLPASEYRGKRLEVKLKPTGPDAEHFYKSLDIDLFTGQASSPTVQIMAAM